MAQDGERLHKITNTVSIYQRAAYPCFYTSFGSGMSIQLLIWQWKCAVPDAVGHARSFASSPGPLPSTIARQLMNHKQGLEYV